MPPSRLRRPLVLLLAAFCLWLCWRRRSGPLCPAPDPALYALRFGGRLKVLVDQPPREDARGLWTEGDLLDYPGQRIRLRFKELSLFDAPRPGEAVAADCAPKRPRRLRNPGDFDERRHLEDRDVQWIAECGRPEVVEAPGGLSRRLRAAAEDVRRFCERRWRAALSGLDARLMAGLVLGYKGPLDRELTRQAQDAGVIHLLVPSGAKVAVVLLGAAWLCALLRAPPAANLALTFALGGFYTLAAGGEPPYARAWLAACFARAGAMLGRDASSFQATLFAAWVQLLWDPASLFTLGFQMSYACAFALAAAFAARRRRARGFLSSTGEHLLVTAVVEAALWPIFANGFGRAALLGALGNVALVPASLPLAALGWLLALLPLAPLARLAAAGLAGFRWACAAFSSLPGAAVELAPMSGAAVAAFYLVLVAALVRFPPAGRAALALAAAALLVGRGSAPRLSVLYLSRPGLHPAAVVRRGTGPPLAVDERRAQALQRRAALAYGWGLPEQVLSLADRPGFRACEGRVCVRFDRPCFVGPAGEFCILALLKKGAVEVSTDGSRVQIKQASDPLRRRLL